MSIVHKIAIFASGSGTNAERIIAHFKEIDDIEISLIISNNKNAYVLTRADNHQIPKATITRQEFYESDQVLGLLKEFAISHIVLAGFMWLVPKDLIRAYPNKMINIHPALLPKYGGKGMYGHHVHEAVVKNKEKESGITIHYVNEEYDEGEHLLQASCIVETTDSPDDVAQKVHQLEYQHYPKVIEDFIRKA